MVSHFFHSLADAQRIAVVVDYRAVEESGAAKMWYIKKQSMKGREYSHIVYHSHFYLFTLHIHFFLSRRTSFLALLHHDGQSFPHVVAPFTRLLLLRRIAPLCPS